MKSYKLIKKQLNDICPNCQASGFDGDCISCGFDATEVDIY